MNRPMVKANQYGIDRRPSMDTPCVLAIRLDEFAECLNFLIADEVRPPALPVFKGALDSLDNVDDVGSGEQVVAPIDECELAGRDGAWKLLAKVIARPPQRRWTKRNRSEARLVRCENRFLSLRLARYVAREALRIGTCTLIGIADAGTAIVHDYPGRTNMDECLCASPLRRSQERFRAIDVGLEVGLARTGEAEIGRAMHDSVDGRYRYRVADLQIAYERSCAQRAQLRRLLARARDCKDLVAICH